MEPDAPHSSFFDLSAALDLGTLPEPRRKVLLQQAQETLLFRFRRSLPDLTDNDRQLLGRAIDGDFDAATSLRRRIPGIDEAISTELEELRRDCRAWLETEDRGERKPSD